MSKRTLLILIAVVVVVVGLVGATRFLSPAGLAPQLATAQEDVIDSMIVERGEMSLALNTTGNIAAAEEVELRFEAETPVREVLVEAGEHVAAGDILARLDTADAEQALREARVRLARAQDAYDALVIEPRAVDVQAVEAEIGVARASIGVAMDAAPDTSEIEAARLEAELARNRVWQSQLERDIRMELSPEFRGSNGGAQAEEIRMGNSIEQSEYSLSIEETQYSDTLNEGPNQSQLGSATADLVRAETELEDLLDGPEADVLRRAEIDLETAALDVERAAERVRESLIIAPISGVVADEFLTVGEVPPSGSAITLISDGSYVIELSIDETDIVGVEVGQEAVLAVDALPDAEISGVVTKVEDAPTIDGQLVTYEVDVQLNPTEARLRSGMSATATLTLSSLEDVIVVPNRFIRVDERTAETFITVDNGQGQYEDVRVVLGERNDSSSQVVDGLEEGQRIVILPRINTQLASTSAEAQMEQ